MAIVDRFAAHGAEQKHPSKKSKRRPVKFDGATRDELGPELLAALREFYADDSDDDEAVVFTADATSEEQIG